MRHWPTKMQRRISQTFADLCRCNRARCVMCQPIIGRRIEWTGRGVK